MHETSRSLDSSLQTPTGERSGRASALRKKLEAHQELISYHADKIQRSKKDLEAMEEEIAALEASRAREQEALRLFQVKLDEAEMEQLKADRDSGLPDLPSSSDIPSSFNLPSSLLRPPLLFVVLFHH